MLKISIVVPIKIPSTQKMEISIYSIIMAPFRLIRAWDAYALGTKYKPHDNDKRINPKPKHKLKSSFFLFWHC